MTPKHPPTLGDRRILLAIQKLMDGVEWTPDTLDSIAELLNDNGYPLRDLEEGDE
jgi:hypothetical protein